MEKNLKGRVKSGLFSYGLMLGYADPLIVEMAAYAGFDFIRIDCEHEMIDISAVKNMIITANHLNLPVIVRLSTLDDITRLLDFGVSGVIVPSVNSKEQAIEAVNLVKYGPIGARGMSGSARYLKYGETKLNPEEANERTLLVIQIETQEALNNINEILSVDGIDMVATGRGDLSQSLGYIGQPTHPKVIEAEDYVITQALKHNKIPNLLANTPERVSELKQKGVYCYSIGRDTEIIYKALKNHISLYK